MKKKTLFDKLEPIKFKMRDNSNKIYVDFKAVEKYIREKRQIEEHQRKYPSKVEFSYDY